MVKQRVATQSVAVYITTKNRRSMLERAVRSVLAQTYQPTEVLIIDDASTDDTPAYLSELASSNPIVRTFRNKKSLGAPSSRNLAIQEAKSPYLTGLDDDDEFLPHRLEDFMTHSHLLDERAALGTSLILKRRRLKIHRKPSLRDVRLEDLLFKNHVGNQVFTLTDRWRSIGGFDPEFPAMQDYDCWVRMTQNFGPIHMLENGSAVIHMEHDAPRITASERRARAASIFYAKHGHLLNHRHQKAARLHQLICSGAPMTLRFGLTNYTPELRREFWRYALLSNSSFLSRLKARIFS